MVIQRIWQTFKVIKNIPLFILDLGGLVKHGELTYELWNGLKFVVRPSSTDAAEVVVINSDYEYPKKYFPKKSNSVILDIGANIGAFSLYINTIVPNLKIYAIEPSSQNMKLLKKNILINEGKNIRTFQLAISDRNGFGNLDISKEFDSFSLVIDKQKTSTTERVKLNTLNYFCVQNKIKKIDLLKIDIEGGEYALFKKSMSLIKKNVRTIIVESHDLDNRHNYHTIIELLKTNRFKILQTINTRTFIAQNLTKTK